MKHLRRSVMIFNFLLLCCVFLQLKKANAQWTTTGPDGGSVTCMSRSGSTIYAVISGGTAIVGPGGASLYTSTDDGNSWTLLNNFSLPTDIRDVAFIRDKIFLGTGTGLYRSDDNGGTWVLKTNGFPGVSSGHWVNRLAVSDTTLFAAATSSKILRSTDFGESWVVKATGLTCSAINALIATDGVVFTGGGSNKKGVFRSTNNGDTWQQTINGMYYFYNGAPVYGYGPNVNAFGYNGTDLYVGTLNSQGVWKTSDNGANWVLTNESTRGSATYNCVAGDGTTVYAGTASDGIFTSGDNGGTWTSANNGIDVYYYVKCLLENGNSVFAGTKTGIYKTVDSGSNWTRACNGVNSQSIDALGAMATVGSQLFIATATSGIYRSSDDGNSWADVNNGLPIGTPGLTTSLYSGTSTLFAYGFMSSDSGNSWVTPNTPGGSSWDNEMPWIEHGSLKFAIKSSSASQGVYRSGDNGNTWELVTNGIDPGSSVFVSIYSDGTTLYLGTDIAYYYSSDNGDNWLPGDFPDYNSWAFHYAKFISTSTCQILGLYGGGGLRGIYRTTDHGAKWDKVSDFLVHRLSMNGNKIWASGTNTETVGGVQTEVPSIFLSLDDGLSWSKVSQGLSVVTSSLASEEGNVYTGTSSSPYNIYRSSDNGASWISINEGLPSNLRVTSIDFFNNKIYAGTQGFSVIQRNLSDFQAPVQPGAIVGSSAPCIGASVTYSVTNVAGVTYSWQFPSGWVVTAGGSTNSVTVTAGSNPGLVLVTPSNSFGVGSAQYMMVSPTTSAPSQPSVITGSTTPVAGTSEVYSVTNEPGVTYTWEFPSDWVLVSGGTTNSVTVLVGDSAGNVTVTPSTPCGTGLPRLLAVTPSSTDKTLTLTSVFLEGLYSGTGQMTQANDENGPHFGSGIADEVTVELHNGSAYSTVEYSATANLTTTGTITLSVPSVHGGSYYVTIRHRNSVETTTAATLSFSGSTVSYAFNAANKAYGDNLVLMAGGNYAIYSGDVNQDGYVDIGDQSEVETQANNFTSGYEVPDLNGDGYIDISDQAIAETNASSFTGAILP